MVISQQYQSLNIINKMSEISFQTNAIANGMVNQIITSFQTQILAKQVVKKLPQKLQQNIKQLTQSLIYAKHLPRPNLKKQPPIKEDIMPNNQVKQSGLMSNVPVISRHNLSRLELESAFHQSTRNSATPRYLSSQQIRVNRKNVKINLQRLNANKVIQLRPQQSTAKSFRSVIELQSRIKDFRRTYLKNLREQERINEAKNKQVISPKRKKIPKEFTFDYDYNLMQSSFEMKKGTVRSPLKTKSISIGQITKKVKNPQLFGQSDSNLEQELARKSTALPEKEKRVYNNSSRRQVSHFPYISLAENSILYENDNILHGPGTASQAQTCYSWKQKSSFTPFFDKRLDEQQPGALITQNEDVVFPATIRKQLSKSMNIDGSIAKNPRFFKKSMKNDEKRVDRIQYNPLNVTRNLAIDQYYKIKALDS